MALTRMQRQGRSLLLTLADPARRNALSAAMIAEIDAILAAAPVDLAALVIEGEGGVFSAGADLTALGAALAQPPAPGAPDPLEALSAEGGRFFARFAALPFVTIAMVDGAAVGGGMGLAAAADIVIASPRARFALTETSLGLPPAQIAPYLVARLGERVARRLALTGARLDAGEALNFGLVDVIGEVDARNTLLAQIERCAPGANAEAKRLLRACGEPRELYIARAARSFSAALRGAEGAEGLAAFAEKRAPRWGAE